MSPPPIRQHDPGIEVLGMIGTHGVGEAETFGLAGCVLESWEHLGLVSHAEQIVLDSPSRQSRRLAFVSGLFGTRGVGDAETSGLAGYVSESWEHLGLVSHAEQIVDSPSRRRSRRRAFVCGLFGRLCPCSCRRPFVGDFRVRSWVVFLVEKENSGQCLVESYNAFERERERELYECD